MGAPAKAAEDALRAGRVSEALEALRESIRSDPSDPRKRVFLFQLNCVMGDWDKALTQLNVAADLDKNNELMAQVGRAALQCEVFRRDVFAGKRSPLLLGEPEPWVGLMIQAVQLSGQGRHTEASAVRGRAFDAAEPVAGSITTVAGEDVKTEEFAWLADADERLGPIVEAIIDGKYYWVPMSHIRSIEIDPPSDLRDLVWAPVSFRWVNGGETVGLMPTRYPGSERSSDGAIQLARQTAFEPVSDDVFYGLGQRMWGSDIGEYSMLQTRSITFGASDAHDAGEVESHG